MKQILREPLVHFLLLGAGLFMAYSLMAQPGSGGAPRKIVITHGQIENLAAGFARAWQRPPTTEEMSGLVRDLVREEVYCREAMAMGLEKDDTVIRRRLRQKMEFISDDIAALAEPTDADLNAYLQAHPDTFRVPQRYTRQWQGPVKSGYGVHLVLVSERTEGHLPALAEVRDAVRREWTNSRRLEANDKFYQELLKRYSVTIEGVEPTTEPKKVAATMRNETRALHLESAGYPGSTIHIAGLSATMTDVLVRIERLDGTTQVTRLTPSAPSFVVSAAAGAMGVARTYTVLGVEHILSGIDHLLFVLALLIITGSGWKIVKTVTAFTVSHSVTLTLAALGYVHVPQRPVEAAIALSIVFVAMEILRGRQGRVGITARAPWIVALTFGLMHGLGFAGGLSEAGLPDGHIPTALLFFSIGVEAGHFLFIGVVLSLMALVLRKLPAPQWAPLVPPYAIGSVAMFWVIQRIAAF